MRVKRIEWMSKDNDMLVVVEERNGIFSVDSKIILPSSCLNGLLNDLQKQNPELEMDALMRIEQWSTEEFNYVFDLEFEFKVNFEIYKENLDHNYRQIRA
jgi:hypothetical protein